MKKIMFLLVFLVIFSNVAFASFSDVRTDNPYFKSIDWLQRNAVVHGYADLTYRAENEVSRAEFLKILSKVKEENPISIDNISLPFSDVKKGNWYADYVAKAYQDKMIEGYGNGTFKPNNPITTTEALKIILNGFFMDKVGKFSSDIGFCKTIGNNSDLSKLIDQKSWFWKYINFANYYCYLPSQMIFDQKNELYFDPNHKLTRGEMAGLTYRIKAAFEHSRCYDDCPDPYPTATYEEYMVPYSILKSNEFVFGFIRVGDQIDSLVVKSLEAFDSSGLMSERNLAVNFDGEITLSGKYYLVKGNEGDLAGQLCFQPNDDDQYKLPREVIDDKGPSWFCFSNRDEAKAQLEGEGTAEIVVDGFSYVYSDVGEYSNFANLLKINIKKKT